MKKTTKALLILYVLLVLLKISLSWFVQSPSIFSDEYLYAKMARGVHEDLSLKVHEQTIYAYPPLYPMVMSLAYIFKDMTLVYFLMKVINALLSSLIIIPTFFLAKEFLKEKEVLPITFIISVLPATFSFAPYILSENLFYPLFMAAVYYIYKAYTTEQKRYPLLAGIAIGLSILARLLGIILIPLVVILSIIKLWKKEVNIIKKVVVMGCLTMITLLPWLISNLKGFFHEYNHGGVLNVVTQPIEYQGLIIAIWIIMYLGFFILSSGIIFFIGNFLGWEERKKDKGLALLSLITFILLVIMTLFIADYNAHGGIKEDTLVDWLSGRPIGRYVDVLLPLLMLNGYIGLTKYTSTAKKMKRGMIVLWGITVLSAQLILFKLWPANNMSISWLGVLKYGLNKFLGLPGTANDAQWSYLVMFTALITMLFASIYLLYTRGALTQKRIIYTTTTLFLLLSIMNITITATHARDEWYNDEQMQLGLWINKNLNEKATFLFDSHACSDRDLRTGSLCHPEHHTTLAGFWINNKLIVGDAEKESADYIISRRTLDLPILKQTESGIYLYTAK